MARPPIPPPGHPQLVYHEEWFPLPGDELMVYIATTSTDPDGRAYDYTSRSYWSDRDGIEFQEFVGRQASVMAQMMVKHGHFFGHQIGPIRVTSGPTDSFTSSEISDAEVPIGPFSSEFSFLRPPRESSSRPPD